MFTRHFVMEIGNSAMENAQKRVSNVSWKRLNKAQIENKRVLICLVFASVYGNEHAFLPISLHLFFTTSWRRY